MKIACLQFAPHPETIETNIEAAESVLASATPEDLQGLDLLVLPELALSGRYSHVLAACSRMFLHRSRLRSIFLLATCNRSFIVDTVPDFLCRLQLQVTESYI